MFPIELRAVTDRAAVAVQLDPFQLVLDSVLTSRRWLGATVLFERRVPYGAFDLRWGLGVDGAFGTRAKAVDGVLRRPFGGAIAPAGRVGVALSGPGDRYHQGLGLRGAVGVRSSQEGATPWARVLVEGTFLWGAR